MQGSLRRGSYSRCRLGAISGVVRIRRRELATAYRSGVRGNGKPFPEGSKIAKVQWKPKKSTEAPFMVDVPNTLADDLFLMEKDSRRFPETARLAARAAT